MNVRNRYYEPVLGRFISRDPLWYIDGMNLQCAYFVLYQAMDPFGLTITVDEKASEEDKKKVKELLDKLKASDPRLKKMVEDLEKSEREHKITPTHKDASVTTGRDEDHEHAPQCSDTQLNLNNLKPERDEPARKDAGGELAHELSHAWDLDTGLPRDVRSTPLAHPQFPSEKRAVATENLYHATNGEQLRQLYEGHPIE